MKIDEVSIKLRDALQNNWRQQGDQVLRDLTDHGELVIIIDELPILLNRLLTEGAAEDGEATREGVRRVDEVMTWLRAACQAHQGRLRFVFCGSIGLGPVLRRAGLSATINHLTPLHLDRWSPEVAAAFLGRVAETYGLAWGPGVVGRVVERAMLASHSHAHLTHYEERLTDVLTARRVPLALDPLTEPPYVRAALHVLLGEFDAALDALRASVTTNPVKPEDLAVFSALPLGLARAGRARDMLDALGDTPFATDRNPWFVALNLVAGTPVRAPREVREAAAELAERMRPPAKTAPERSKRRHAGASPGRRT